MNVTNCKNCGRLFNVISSSERLCPACKQALEEKFQEVKEYLNGNRNASMEMVSKEMDVSIKQIRQWIREERLTFSDESMDGIECERCGKMIKTGRYCAQCKAEMANTLQSALDKPKKAEPKKIPVHEKDRMRYLN
ncbi:MAG: flagellar protein [Clostridiales bacterium]|nr:flagellar protein [Clostridiales bacterium]